MTPPVASPYSVIPPLPFDTARCPGHVSAAAILCHSCRRTEPGRREWQAYIAPALRMDRCENYMPREQYG